MCKNKELKKHFLQSILTTTTLAALLVSSEINAAPPFPLIIGRGLNDIAATMTYTDNWYNQIIPDNNSALGMGIADTNVQINVTHNFKAFNLNGEDLSRNTLTVLNSASTGSIGSIGNSNGGATGGFQFILAANTTYSFTGLGSTANSDGFVNMGADDYTGLSSISLGAGSNLIFNPTDSGNIAITIPITGHGTITIAAGTASFGNVTGAIQISNAISGITFADGAIINGTIDSSVNPTNVEGFATNNVVANFNGTSTVSGIVGNTYPVMNLNVNGGTVTFQSNVNALAIGIANGGMDCFGNLTTGKAGWGEVAVLSDAASFIKLEADSVFTGSVVSQFPNKGAIYINGNSSIFGSVGTGGLSIEKINFLGAYTLNLGTNIDPIQTVLWTNIKSINDGQGTLHATQSFTLNGDIGTYAGNGINGISVSENQTFVFTGNIWNGSSIPNITLGSGATMQTIPVNTVTYPDLTPITNPQINANFVGSTPGVGTLKISTTGVEINGAIGGTGNSIFNLLLDDNSSALISNANSVIKFESKEVVAGHGQGIQIGNGASLTIGTGRTFALTNKGGGGIPTIDASGNGYGTLIFLDGNSLATAGTIGGIHGLNTVQFGNNNGTGQNFGASSTEPITLAAPINATTLNLLGNANGATAPTNPVYLALDANISNITNVYGNNANLVVTSNIIAPYTSIGQEGDIADTVNIIFNDADNYTLTMGTAGGQTMFGNISAPTVNNNSIVNITNPLTLTGTVGPNIHSFNVAAATSVSGSIAAPVTIATGATLTINGSLTSSSIEGPGSITMPEGGIFGANGGIAGTQDSPLAAVNFNGGTSVNVMVNNIYATEVNHASTNIITNGDLTISGNYSANNAILTLNEGKFTINGTTASFTGTYTINNAIEIDFGDAEIDVTDTNSINLVLDGSKIRSNGDRVMTIIANTDELDALLAKFNTPISGNVFSVITLRTTGVPGVAEALYTLDLSMVTGNTSLSQAVRDDFAVLSGDAIALLTAIGTLAPNQVAEAVSRLAENSSSASTSSIMATTEIVTETIVSRMTSIASTSLHNSEFGPSSSELMSLTEEVVAPDANSSDTPSDKDEKPPEEKVPFSDSYSEGVAAGSEAEKYGIWANALGGIAKQGQLKGSPGSQSDLVGGVIGVDTMISEDSTLGVALGNSVNYVKYKNLKKGDKSLSNSWIFAAYGNYQLNNKWFVRGNLTSGYTSITSKALRFDGIKGTLIATSRYNVKSYGIDASVGYNHQIWNNSTLTPSFGIRTNYLTGISYTETGAGVQNKTISQKATTSTSLTGGLQLATMLYKNNMQIMPEGHVNMQYGLGIKTPQGKFKLESGSHIISYMGTRPSLFFTSIGGSITAASDNIEYSVGYDMNIADKYLGHQGSIKMRVRL